MGLQSNDLVSPLASPSGFSSSSLGTKHRKILIMGLPGAGKTTLAKALASRLNAVHFNADDVRREVHKDLGFREPDRIEHARRMGWLCDQVTKTGCFAIADFICPTPDARAAFTAGGEAFIVWMDRVTKSRFDDTDRMFLAPERHDLRVPAEGTGRVLGRAGGQAHTADLRPQAADGAVRWSIPTVSRGTQSAHCGGIAQGSVRLAFAVRDTGGADETNPFEFEYVRARIEATRYGNSRDDSLSSRFRTSHTYSSGVTSATA